MNSLWIRLSFWFSGVIVLFVVIYTATTIELVSVTGPADPIDPPRIEDVTHAESEG